MIFIKFILILLFLLSCDKKAEFQNLFLQTKFETIKDSIYLIDVRGISIEDTLIMFCDASHKRVYSLNKNSLKLIDEIGYTGNGPHEISELANYFYLNGMYYVLDGGSLSCKIYNNKNKFLNSIRIGNNGGDSRFLQNKGILIVNSAFDEKSSVIGLNIVDGKIVKNYHIKKFIEKDRKENQSNLDIRIVLLINGKLLSISKSLPFLEFSDFDMTYNKLITFDDIEFFKKQKILINEEYNKLDFKSKNKTTILLNEDAYVNGNNIYILCYDRTDKITCNKIIKFELDSLGENLVYKNSYSLNDTWYSSIAIDNNRKLYAYNKKKSQMEVYDLGI